MEDDLLIARLSALGQRTRLSVYRAIAEGGPSGIQTGAVAQLVEMPPNYLAKHLQILVDAGLVAKHVRGRTATYVAEASAVVDLIDALGTLPRN